MSEDIGCGDNSCVFSVIKQRGGMGTNGGCRCFKHLESWIESEQRWNRPEVRKVQRDVLRLAQAYRGLRREIGELLSENGCDCECDCAGYSEPHGADCEPCLACRVQDALGTT